MKSLDGAAPPEEIEIAEKYFRLLKDERVRIADIEKHVGTYRQALGQRQRRRETQSRLGIDISVSDDSDVNGKIQVLSSLVYYTLAEEAIDLAISDPSMVNVIAMFAAIWHGHQVRYSDWVRAFKEVIDSSMSTRKSKISDAEVDGFRRMNRVVLLDGAMNNRNTGASDLKDVLKMIFDCDPAIAAVIQRRHPSTRWWAYRCCISGLVTSFIQNE